MKKPCNPSALRLLAALILLTVVSITSVQGQSVIYSENFETSPNSFTLNTADLGGATNGYNDWIVNNAYTGGSGTLICLGFPFSFTVNNSPSQPAAIFNSPNSNYLHMLADNAASNNIFNSNYQPADGTCQAAESNFSSMSSDISTLGANSVTLSFWWMGAGSATSFGEVYYSTNSGTSWTQITAPISQYNNQSTWVQQTITNPAFDNQPTLRFGFRFVNNVSQTGADPAFSVDDIEVTGLGCSAVLATQVANICAGDSLFAGGAFQTQTGMYVDTLVSSQGCDSILTTDLTVNPSPLLNIAATICEGDSIFLAGAFQTTAGSYTDQFTTAAGCDSTIITVLAVNPSPVNSATASICEGDSIFLGGNWQTTAGTYTDVFQTSLGCDSTEVTTLTVIPAVQSSAAEAICQGDSIFLGGAFQTTAGTYTDTFQSSQGCDSTVSTTLTVTTIDVSVDTSMFGTLTANASPATYQWIDCTQNTPLTGVTSQSFTPGASGTFAVVVDANGCSDTSACYTVTISSTSEGNWQGTLTAFPNPVNSDLQIDLGQVKAKSKATLVNPLGQEMRTVEGNGLRILTMRLDDLAAGLYFLRVEAGKEQMTLRIVKK